MAPTFNGQLRANALMRFQRIRGDFLFQQCGSPLPTNPPVPVPESLGNAITQTTDSTGVATVCIFVPLGARSQVASYRIFDVASGVYTDEIFIIDGDTPAGTLTAVPNTITFTGTNGRCGTGSADFLVFDGNPPYTATSTNGSVAVAPSTSATDPGRFTVTLAVQGPPCPSGVQIVVTDVLGARGTVTVDSVQGPAGPPLVTAPSAFTLGCQQSGTAVVVGGSGTYSAFSSGGGVSATVGGNQVRDHADRRTGRRGARSRPPSTSPTAPRSRPLPWTLRPPASDRRSHRRERASFGMPVSFSAPASAHVHP